jgi:hypothetical protein
LIKLNGAQPALGLRGFEPQAEFLGLLPCALNPERLFLAVEIGPAQRQQFAPACASGGCERHFTKQI